MEENVSIMACQDTISELQANLATLWNENTDLKARILANHEWRKERFATEEKREIAIKEQIHQFTKDKELSQILLLQGDRNVERLTKEVERLAAELEVAEVQAAKAIASLKTTIEENQTLRSEYAAVKQILDAKSDKLGILEKMHEELENKLSQQTELFTDLLSLSSTIDIYLSPCPFVCEFV